MNEVTIRKIIEEKMGNIKAALTSFMIETGERCVSFAKEHGNYQNHTYQLRESIGFIVVSDGNIIKLGGFEGVGGGFGETFARQLARSHTKGLVLLVVAGKNYASYVEAKGYDVITGSEILAHRILNALFDGKNGITG